MLFEQDLAAIEQNRGVHGRLAGVRLGQAARLPRQRCWQSAGGRGKFIDGRSAAGKKARLLKEVGGGISADGQLGEDGEAGALVGSAAGNRKNFFEIAGEIPDRGVDLGQCDLHTFSLKQEGKESRTGRTQGHRDKGLGMSCIRMRRNSAF